MAEIKRRRERGRPPVPPELQRKHGVTCRLTDAELDRVDAARGGVSRGEYIRLAALDAPPRVVPEVNRAAWLELSKASANLNQIARVANAKGMLTGRDMIFEIRDQVEILRQMLLGIDVKSDPATPAATDGGADEGED